MRERKNDPEEIGYFAERTAEIRRQMGRVIIGQESSVELLILAVLCGRHCLLEGVPGLAKTLMINTLARLFSLDFSRIQFTPDMLPSDLLGTEILVKNPADDEGRKFQFLRGPIFAHLILADEINRTPPKTQSALLEGMEERSITVGGRTHSLSDPFSVFATQNPIEQQGTYRLPQAQLDRFLFQVNMDYPSAAEERTIVKRTTSQVTPGVKPIMNRQELLRCQELVCRIPVPVHVREFAIRLVRCTRETEGSRRFPFLKEWVSWGSSPRGAQGLIMAARTRALMQGRHFATLEDVEFLACSVLRHRLVLTYRAEGEAVTADDVILKLTDFLKPLRNRMKPVLSQVCI